MLWQHMKHSRRATSPVPAARVSLQAHEAAANMQHRCRARVRTRGARGLQSTQRGCNQHISAQTLQGWWASVIWPYCSKCTPPKHAPVTKPLHALACQLATCTVPDKCFEHADVLGVCSTHIAKAVSQCKGCSTKSADAVSVALRMQHSQWLDLRGHQPAQGSPGPGKASDVDADEGNHGGGDGVTDCAVACRGRNAGSNTQSEMVRLLLVLSLDLEGCAGRLSQPLACRPRCHQRGELASSTTQ